MPQFRYTAIDKDGNLVEGEFQATDQTAAISWIRGHGHTPIKATAKELRPERPSTGSQLEIRNLFRRNSGKARDFDVRHFTRDLSTLMAAGVPLERSLEILVDLSNDENTTVTLRNLLDNIREGASLSEAMALHDQLFGKFYLNMVKAGEAGGAVDAILERLSIFLEKYQQLRNEIKSALIYPAILAFVTIVSIIILVAFVLPQFAMLFDDMGQELPLPTRIVMDAGDALRHYGWLLLAGAALLAGFLRNRMKDPDFRLKWDTRLLKLPVLGELVCKVEVAVFSRTLATLLGSGVPLLSALGIVKNTLKNTAMSRAIHAMSEEVSEGQSLAKPMADSGVFPGLASHLVQVGEETGQLESTLIQLTDIYDQEVSQSIQRMLTLVEPVLIIGMGIVIGGIIMSILIAVLSVNELAF